MRGRLRSAVVAAGTFLIVIGLAAGGYYAWTRAQAALITLDARLGQIEAQLQREERPLPNGLDLSAKLQTFLKVPADGEQGVWTPVSLAPIGPSTFIVANYNNLYVVDEMSATITPLRKPDGVPIWNPTAVYYSLFYNLLFVANYTGQDVLVLALDRSTGGVALRLVEQITEGIKGAEGIVVSQGGRYLAVANWEGASVALFERRGGSSNLRWSAPLVSAHEVTIIDDEIFASGVELVRFRLDGMEIARVHELGGAPLLFATCVNPTIDGGLVVSDTMSGSVWFTTRDFQVHQRIGQNGPTYRHLDMPYCSYEFGSRVFILSTYQSRIITIENGMATSWLSTRGWNYLDQVGFPNSQQWRGPTKFDHPPVALWGKEFMPGYGSLAQLDGKGILLLPNRKGMFSAGWLYYVATVAQSDDYVVILSNSSPEMIVYRQADGGVGSAMIGQWDCWASGGDVLCPDRARSVAEIAALAKFIDGEREVAEGDALAQLVSEPGKALAARAGEPCQMAKAVGEYESAVAAGATVLFSEYAISQMILRSAARRCTSGVTNGSPSAAR